MFIQSLYISFPFAATTCSAIASCFRPFFEARLLHEGRKGRIKLRMFTRKAIEMEEHVLATTHINNRDSAMIITTIIDHQI
jgi:hypothetical protein